MAWTLEVTLALLTILFVAGPAFILWRAYARTRRRRILFAALGFTFFLITDVIVLADQLGFTPNINETEIVEFMGDILTAACFAAAFLLPAAGDP